MFYKFYEFPQKEFSPSSKLLLTFIIMKLLEVSQILYNILYFVFCQSRPNFSYYLFLGGILICATIIAQCDWAWRTSGSTYCPARPQKKTRAMRSVHGPGSEFFFCPRVGAERSGMRTDRYTGTGATGSGTTSGSRFGLFLPDSLELGSTL